MAKEKHRISTDRLLGLTAMMISMVTLIIFIYQTNLMRKQNYISVLPYLDFATTANAGDDIFRLSLKNHGVGPAIIESIVLKYNDSVYDVADYEDDVWSTLKAIVPALDSVRDLSTATLGKGMAIPANSTYTILAVKGDPTAYQLVVGTLQQLLEQGLDYDLIYKSILNERWIIHDDSEGPEEL